MYIKQLTEVILPSVLHKQIAILVFYYVSSRLVTLLKLFMPLCNCHLFLLLLFL